MKIIGIEMSIEEMRESVERWLDGRGLRVKVDKVTPCGYPVNLYEIEIVNDESKEETPCD